MELENILKFLTILIGFYMAWNIGANDVSNAMGTSVGSKALTMKKAVILAAILEFAGAFFLGSHVSETIQQGIIKPEIFHADPMIFAIGMMGALLATGVWLNLASYFRLPVSTTHAIVGAVLGFGAIIGGIHAVHWGGVLTIVLSWLISPILSGLIAFLLFGILQKKILFALNPLEATKKLIPFFVFFAFSFFSLSLIFQGLANLHLNMSFPKALWISMGVGIVAAFITFFLTKRIHVPSFATTTCNYPHQLVSLEKAAKHLQRTKLASCGETEEKISKLLNKVRGLVHSVKETTEITKQASQYTQVEKTFVYLQIISAALVAFAHGANDVSNAIGPVAAVLQVLHTKVIGSNPIMPLWVLLLGGAGIVIGLATWGWRVIETIGKKITELTPTRGFCAEFAAAITILLASKMGLPISTTHALVGAVLGVGLARGITALNLKTLRDIALSWVITIPICAILSILIFYLLRAIF